MCDDKTWERLWTVLDEDDGDQIVYGYRIDQAGNVKKPYLFCRAGHSGLVEEIQAEFGPGEYRLLIRKGRVMLFSGKIAIGPAPASIWG